ncbi:uncharacterized protein [Temnothorax nylanderi]|uniref:uncharacterized protein n=1 Tax=Temnothorax nylanderi TaxID=102681 RepID=UPI003A856813
MSIVESPEEDGFYMPHHAVIKESSHTTKVRVVFDASAKTSNGVSLNDILMTGPTIQNKLFSHLIRFRVYVVVITADIEKMYRQVLVHKDDRRYQKILWRRDGEIKTLQSNTLTFGNTASPFLAIRAVVQLAEDEGQAYPRAAEVLKEHMYVDNVLSGAKNVEEACATRDETINLLSQGGFTIKQWASNEKEVIEDLAEGDIHANFTVTIDRSLNTLGIMWNTRTDKICYSAQTTKPTEKITKRRILAEIAKIFDPLGLLGPVVLYAKKLMQDVWRCGIHWDESIPQGIYTEWSEFARQLDLINTVSIDRRLLINDHQKVQLHGFCDASNVGYGACLYVRSKGNDGSVVSKLLCAKSRVAPLKLITIPRLELCGALLLARLYRETINELGINIDETNFWCDATIVLQWLKMSPHMLKTYVANRVAEIQELTSGIKWRHVRSEDNPADAISRGQLPHVFLKNRTWFTGPPWLVENEAVAGVTAAATQSSSKSKEAFEVGQAKDTVNLKRSNSQSS